MRERFVSTQAKLDLRDIADFIATDNPSAAERYLLRAFDTFAQFPDEVLTPKPVSPDLPSNVSEIQVDGFKGYTLRIMITDTALFLLCAFRPGLPDDLKDVRTERGLTDI